MTIAFDDRSALVGTDDGGGDNTLSLRCSLLTASLTAASGTTGQIVIYFGTANGASAADGHVTYDLTYIGQGTDGSGTAGPTFTGNQVQVKWGGAAGVNGILGSSFTGVISANVLTVSALTGTMVPNSQIISGAGVNAVLGTQITGTAGLAGTYNLTNANVSSEAMTGTGFVTSDTFTLGETFDHTHTYVFAFDTHASGAIHNTTDTNSNVNVWFISTVAGTIASTTTPSGTWSKVATSNTAIAELIITGAASATWWEAGGAQQPQRQHFRATGGTPMARRRREIKRSPIIQPRKSLIGWSPRLGRWTDMAA